MNLKNKITLSLNYLTRLLTIIVIIGIAALFYVRLVNPSLGPFLDTAMIFVGIIVCITCLLIYWYSKKYELVARKELIYSFVIFSVLLVLRLIPNMYLLRALIAYAFLIYFIFNEKKELI